VEKIPEVHHVDEVLLLSEAGGASEESVVLGEDALPLVTAVAVEERKGRF
jgi:hypothetical protein